MSYPWRGWSSRSDNTRSSALPFFHSRSAGFIVILEGHTIRSLIWDTLIVRRNGQFVPLNRVGFLVRFRSLCKRLPRHAAHLLYFLERHVRPEESTLAPQP